MDVDDLTDEQRNALSRFQEFTHIDSIETCRQYLTAHEWDVERAINTALISYSDPPSDRNDHNRITTDFISSSSFVDQSQSTERIASNSSIVNRDTENFFLRILRLPIAFFYALFLIIGPFIPWTVIHFVYSFIQSLFGSIRPVDPLKEIDDYRIYFDNQFGTSHPPFYRGRLAQALRDAQREVRLLFIYLHDKNSTLCDRFCREVLCQEPLSLAIGDNLLWSASRDTQEGAQASRLLHTNSFPCFSIVAHHGSQQTVQLQLNNYRDTDEFLAEIINGIQNADEVLEHNRQQRNSRNSRDRLLEEQNAAYLDSVRADQEKAEKRKQEENERRELEENQRLLKEEEQRKLEKFEKFRDDIRQRFPDEPSSTDNDTIQVSIRLPADEPIRRRFHRTDPAKLLFEFAWTNLNVPNQFELLWGYPRKRYQYKQMGNKQIGDVMSGNTETCFLEEIDEENNL